MSVPTARLMETCESLCERLRRTVGLTTFRIELQRSTRPLVVSLRAPDAPSGAEPSPDRAGHPPARLELVLRHDDRVVARLRIEDEHRAWYADDARATCERIAAGYSSDLSDLLAASAT